MMMQTIAVTDEPESWAFLKSFTPVVDASTYLLKNSSYKKKSVRVINLCRTYQYQSMGYYVSLLAEARLHSVVPSTEQIQDALNTPIADSIFKGICFDRMDVTDNSWEISVYFGQAQEKKYQAWADKLYRLFPLPLMKVLFIKNKQGTRSKIVPLGIDDVPKLHVPFMHAAAVQYFNQKPLNPTHKKPPAYHLALLVEPREKTPPSNQKAIEQFLASGKACGLHVDLVTKKDIKNINQYDGLLIRATTSVNHYTYQLSRCAERNHLIVIDDPQSIVRCTNKIFLAELFDQHKILTLETHFISKYDATLPAIAFPCVLKRPDGSCSKGVIKIDNLKRLKQALHQFFKTSDLLIVQPFIPTDFDWRIGIIDNQPLYACRYYMAKNHWQIVNWNCAIEDDILIHDTVSLSEVPEAVLEVALKSTAFIGSGLYGVDIKSVHDKHYVIEVNDNPSINFGIEDKLLQHSLYEKIMDVFLQRLNARALGVLSRQ
jgi:glutathione synthase/RimK-type ligase-like ATP-grasp enzyme